MENTIFSKHNGSHRAVDFRDSEIDQIQRQLDALRDRLISPAQKSGLTDRDRVRIVRNLCHARLRRNEIIGPNLFFDPAWDILLEVYLAELEQRRVSVSNIGLTSGVPASTTIRWLTKLEEAEMLIKRDDPLDGRRVFISMTETATQMMNAYLDECWPLLH